MEFFSSFLSHVRRVWDKNGWSNGARRSANISVPSCDASRDKGSGAQRWPVTAGATYLCHLESSSSIRNWRDFLGNGFANDICPINRQARAREARSKCKNYPGGGGGGTCRIERGEILAIVNKICRKIRFKVKDDFLRNESSEHGPRRMRIRLNTPRYTGRRMPQVYHMGSAKALSSPPLNATMVLLSAHA